MTWENVIKTYSETKCFDVLILRNRKVISYLLVPDYCNEKCNFRIMQVINPCRINKYKLKTIPKSKIDTDSYCT